MVNEDNLEIYPLKKIKNTKSKLFFESKKWVLSMTNEIDNENGLNFWNWIEKNLKRENSFFQTYILYNNQIKKVIGIASIIPDDQNISFNYNIAGFWLGGFNIHKDYRNLGYGQYFLKKVKEKIQIIAKLNSFNMYINLFTDNPIAIRIYEKSGFKFYKEIKVENWSNKEKVYRLAIITNE